MDYIKTNSTYFKQLLDVLLSKYPYASILVEDSISKVYVSTKDNVSVAEQGWLTNRGYTIRILENEKIFEYSSNLIEDIPDILKKIEKNKIIDGKGYPSQINDESVILRNDSQNIIFSDEYILDKITSITKKGLEDSNIIQFQTRFSYCTSEKWFISKNKNMLQVNTWSQGGMTAFVKQGDKVRNYYKGFSIYGGMELLDSMEKSIDIVINIAKELLNVESLKPGKYTCICDPSTTGMIVHEAFGHGVEMDMFVKDRALAKHYINKQVASNLITMHDSAKSVQESATYKFDDEGNLSTDTIIIDKGILKTGICDELAAQRLGVKPTGNGRRENFSRKAYTRMTNTYFENGDSELSEMIKSVDYGFLLENPTSGMEDPKNWGIQCMVNIAREIKNGEFTGKIFSPIVLTGYVPEILKNISMVSKDFELFGSGFCGKGHKEWVKVSDGGPYIKTQIVLG